MPKAKITLLLPSDSSDCIFQPVNFLVDSHGRWMNNHVRMCDGFSFNLHFLPEATSADLYRVAPQGTVREGYIIIHIGGNDITTKDGSEKASAQTVIDDIFNACNNVKKGA